MSSARGFLPHWTDSIWQRLCQTHNVNKADRHLMVQYDQKRGGLLKQFPKYTLAIQKKYNWLETSVFILIHKFLSGGVSVICSVSCVEGVFWCLVSEWPGVIWFVKRASDPQFAVGGSLCTPAGGGFLTRFLAHITWTLIIFNLILCILLLKHLF